MGGTALVLALGGLLVAQSSAIASEWRPSGFAAAEVRAFFQSPLDPAQHDENLSLVLQPEFARTWNSGRDVFAFVPFVRLDEHDDERSHVDVRELTWSHAADSWELRLGVRKVFWGVTESQHLVDIINQTDLVENPDGEDKLGQPMINVALFRNWGTVDFFVLTGFRERTFPGREGRLRLQPRVDTDQRIYESSREREHIDFAARWSHFFGEFDIGLSHFHGTSRDPRFALDTSDPEDVVLVPIYEQIDQTGLDIQFTRGAWLWKLEAIRRTGQGQGFFAATGGFEYTLFGLGGSAADLGVVAEYLYDDRRDDARPAFENDVFLGLRLTLNDVQSSEALVGCIVDVDDSGSVCSLEASRRVGESWLVSLESRVFSDLAPDDPLFSLRRDDYVQLELAYYF